MKILRKGDKFQKRKETTDDDIRAIKELVGAGWSYCDKQTWKREVRDRGELSKSELTRQDKGKNVEEG
jgi:hypothetical protein